MDGAAKMNKEVRGWGRDSLKDLKDAFARLKIVHRDNSPSPLASVDALNNRFTQQGGMINKVAFKFPKHMIFVHKGVGKGVGIGYTGSTTRVAKEWYNPVMDKKIEDLADIVADNQGDIVANNLLIK